MKANDAVAIAAHRATVETEIVRLFLANRVRGLEILKAAGVDVWAFDQDDLRVLFIACRYRPTGDVLNVLIVARQLLKRLSLWDDTAIAAGTGMLWSDRRLARFATSLSPLDDTAHLARLAVLAVELVDIAREFEGRAAA